MGHLSIGLRSPRHLTCHAKFVYQAVMALSLGAAFFAPVAGQGQEIRREVAPEGRQYRELEEGTFCYRRTRFGFGQKRDLRFSSQEK